MGYLLSFVLKMKDRRDQLMRRFAALRCESELAGSRGIRVVKTSRLRKETCRPEPLLIRLVYYYPVLDMRINGSSFRCGIFISFPWEDEIRLFAISDHEKPEIAFYKLLVSVMSFLSSSGVMVGTTLSRICPSLVK